MKDMGKMNLDMARDIHDNNADYHDELVTILDVIRAAKARGEKEITFSVYYSGISVEALTHDLDLITDIKIMDIDNYIFTIKILEEV